MKTNRMKFIVEPQDDLSLNMDKIRGGTANDVEISCKPGRVKCKKDGNIESSDAAFELLSLM